MTSPNIRVLSLRLSEDLAAELEDIARRERRTLTAQIIYLVEKALNEKQDD